jgi:hypothetical protein
LKKTLDEGDVAQNVRLGDSGLIYVPTKPIADLFRFTASLEQIAKPFILLETEIPLSPNGYNQFTAGNAPAQMQTIVITTTRENANEHRVLDATGHGYTETA